MPLITICLLAGAYLLGWLPRVPDIIVLAILGAASTTLAACQYARVPALVVAGFSAMGLAATLQLADRLDPALASSNIDAVVTVTEFPVSRNGIVNLVVSPRAPTGLPSRIRLSWLEPNVIPGMGQEWHLTVRLRPPSGYANPGGFDFEGWLFRQKTGATGYVVQDGRNYRVHGEPAGFLARLRRHVVDRLNSTLPRDEAAAVLLAVVVGARHEITRAQWDQYAETGTSHLMAISGLHVGLAAAAVFLLVRGGLSVLPGKRNCRDPALIASLVAALLYAAMSGFAVPARRACIMLIIAGGLILRRREVSPSILLATTAAVIFITDPLAILAPGFKMSFAAVAVLFLAATQHIVTGVSGYAARPITSLLQLGRIQVALLAGLLPLTVVLFERFTAIAPLANILVLPIFNFVTVPFALLGTILDGPAAPAGDYLLMIAHKSVDWVLTIVSWASAIDWLSFRTSVPVNAVVLALPVLHILLPAGWPGRRVVLLAVISVVTTKPEPLPAACFSYHVLDVGQGLAVVVRTRDHALLFDTGPAFQSGSNTAELVVLPFLRYAGIGRLDTVIVSHGDLDHAGGIRNIIMSTKVGKVMTGEVIPALGNAQIACRAGQRWRWNGVNFRVLHPRESSPWQGNNSSCVLEIAAGTNRLLLTGDIETPVELLLQYRQIFRPSLAVVVPHHGSGTSSSASLVDVTSPAIAIVSAGRRNRWGFPRQDVVARWQFAGAQVISTAVAGAVSQQLCPDRVPEVPATARTARWKYWHEHQQDQL